MKYTGIITREGKWYVAHCLELGVVTQGKTLEEAQVNLREAVDLFLESFGSDDAPDATTEVLLYQIEVSIGA
jgi:predicted RNase H-like HicB family nuclease